MLKRKEDSFVGSFIEKKGGYTNAHEQMRRQLDFLLIELNKRQDEKISEIILDEKPFIIGEDPKE